jgi:signal transduction histidine kinase
LGYVNALRDGTIEDKQLKEEALDIIFAKSLTLEHLIKELLQLSKLETKQFSFCFMLINTAELSRDLINQHIFDIKTAGLKLTFKINKGVLMDKYIIVDPERISQVFSNIIFNAIKFTLPNDKLDVKFGLDKKNENYTVTVYDSGSGISQNDLPFIFDRFFKAGSATQSKRESNTGLGLAISKEIIEAHKGTIIARSRLGKGSAFTFTIPLYKE